MLTPRQELILRKVVEGYRAGGQPLGSKLLAEDPEITWGSSTVRYELAVLQPQVVMVVVITSTGGVTKRLFAFDEPVDPGIADWAAAYLNERLTGMGVGARMLSAKLGDPSLSAVERGFLERLVPSFTELAETADHTLYVDGAARLLREHRFQDVSQLNELMALLERRVTLLGVLASALDERDVVVRI